MYSQPLGNYRLRILVVSDLTLDHSFKVKLGQVSIKVPITLCLKLIIGPRGLQCTVDL